MDRERLILAVVVVIALSAVGLPLRAVGRETHRAERPEMVGRIIFSSDRSGAWRIWTVRPDGSGMTQLSKAADDEDDVDPGFSPDGKRILFTSTRGGKTGTWIMAADRSDPKRICDGDQAEWSPDAKRIVFRRDGRILVRDLVTGKEKTITPKDWTTCGGPAWSPDGKTIAFARLRDRANAIYTVPADGGEPAKVYDRKGACEPHFSPDGSRIIYETETHVWTIHPDGTKNRPVTYFGGVQRYARFSPDGRSVVFCQAPSPRGPWELYILPAAGDTARMGGTPRKLTDQGSDMYPDWK